MPQSAAHIRATTRFESKAYDKITLRLRKDRPDTSGLSRDSIQAAADAEGKSINAYILEAVKEKMNK
jgi:uncharacterized protein (DUF1778 family)